MNPAKATIATANPDLRLVPLTPDDAPAYYDLVACNRDHLTQHGDYSKLGEATPASVAASLRDERDGDSCFGIWLGARLIGRPDLSPRTPGHVVLGNWLGVQYAGKGYATAACKALVETTAPRHSVPQTSTPASRRAPGRARTCSAAWDFTPTKTVAPTRTSSCR